MLREALPAVCLAGHVHPSYTKVLAPLLKDPLVRVAGLVPWSSTPYGCMAGTCCMGLDLVTWLTQCIFHPSPRHGILMCHSIIS
jgi:hypothetical protein